VHLPAKQHNEGSPSLSGASLCNLHAPLVPYPCMHTHLHAACLHARQLTPKDGGSKGQRHVNPPTKKSHSIYRSRRCLQRANAKLSMQQLPMGYWLVARTILWRSHRRFLVVPWLIIDLDCRPNNRACSMHCLLYQKDVHFIFPVKCTYAIIKTT
jgi:hypothetical protein